ncbi:MAG: competence/damage-inducible protein A [Verrucomicrobia bacterium]|nr:competence/damage-inducible protein A [Verrucomicrobiota bacterium]
MNPPALRLEVLNTGSELLLGAAVNTHLAFLGEHLFRAGLRVERQTAVPDGPAIGEAMREAFRRCDILLVTGGLGPTSDDITRELTAELLGLTLAPDATVLARLHAYYERLGRTTTPQIERQALVPDGAQVLENAHGTAPGLYLPPRPFGAAYSPHVFLLPGPPRELRPMVLDQLLPRLGAIRRAAGLGVPARRTFRLFGLGESFIEQKVGDALLALPELELGYCARVGEVDLRLIGPFESVERGATLVRAEPSFAGHIFTEEGESLEEVIVHRLQALGQTVATAESCTGGLLAHRLTNVPGASQVFLAGPVVYSNAAKESLLGVPAALLAEFGAVSEPVAQAMARQVRQRCGTDFGLATTGLAGPGGASRDKPVGTLFFALAGPGEACTVRHRVLSLTDRESFKHLATQHALNLLREALSAPR